MRETRNPCAAPRFLAFSHELRSTALIWIGVL